MKTIIGTVGIAFLILSGCSGSNANKYTKSSCSEKGVTKVKSNKVVEYHGVITPQHIIDRAVDIYGSRYGASKVANEVNAQNKIMREILIELKEINKTNKQK